MSAGEHHAGAAESLSARLLRAARADGPSEATVERCSRRFADAVTPSWMAPRLASNKWPVVGKWIAASAVIGAASLGTPTFVRRAPVASEPAAPQALRTPSA